MRTRCYLCSIVIIVCMLSFACTSKKTLSLRPRLDKVQAQRHYEYGLSSLQLGQAERAQREFTTAKDFNPDDAYIYLGLGQALQQQGKLKRAAEAFEEGIRHNSSLPSLFHRLGEVYLQLEDWPQAVHYTLIALDFEDFEQRSAALYNLGRGYMGIRSWEQARYTLEAVLVEEPQFIPAQWHLVLVLEQLGNWAEIIRHCRRILYWGQKHPHQADNLLLSQVNELMGEAYSKLGKPQLGKKFGKRAALLRGKTQAASFRAD